MCYLWQFSITLRLHFFEALRLHKTEKEKENHQTNHWEKCSGGGGGGVYEGAITGAGLVVTTIPSPAKKQDLLVRPLS